MGGGSKSSQSTSQADNRVGAEGGGLAAGANANVSVATTTNTSTSTSTTNYDAFDENVERAFRELVNFGSDALNTVKDTVRQTVESSQSFGREALETVRDTVKSGQESNKNVVVELAQTRQLQTTGQTAQSMNPTPLILGVLALGALFIFTRKS